MMRNKKFFMLVIIGVVIVALGLFWGGQYAKINSVYPASKSIQAKVGDVINYEDFEFRIESSEYYTYNEMIATKEDLIDYTEYENNFDKEDLLFVFVSVSVKNTSENNTAIPLYNLAISSNTYSNGIDITTFAALNGSLEMLTPTFSANEEKKIVFTYTLLKSACFDNNSLPELELILSLYPERKSLLLPLEKL